LKIEFITTIHLTNEVSYESHCVVSEDSSFYFCVSAAKQTGVKMVNMERNELSA
jgi:hypothetical protein